MQYRFIGAILLLAFPSSALWAADESTALKRADLENLVGVWELKADPKEGWKGTVRATFTLYKADGKAADFGRILYDYDLADGTNKIAFANAPSGGISFAGVKRGKTTMLVTSTMFARPAPFMIDPMANLAAPFELKEDTLILDLSKSHKAFVPSSVSKMQIDWSKSTWVKVKK